MFFQINDREERENQKQKHDLKFLNSKRNNFYDFFKSILSQSKNLHSFSIFEIFDMIQLSIQQMTKCF